MTTDRLVIGILVKYALLHSLLKRPPADAAAPIKINNIEIYGEGALRQKIEQLKKKLAKDGVFDNTRDIMPYPENIGVITIERYTRCLATARTHPTLQTWLLFSGSRANHSPC